jgi:molybdate transport system ATP-binding protein
MSAGTMRQARSVDAEAAGLAGRFRLQRGGFLLDVEIAGPARGVTAVFGPSGSGKTTLLRCAAGLEHAPEGRFAVAGEVWQDEARGVFLPPHRRPLGYVAQEAALFPHLSVAGNLRYGLRRTPPERRRVDWDWAVEGLGLAPLLGRRPERLSGGERQRVAIGRALLRSPGLLLLDEPLAALDAAARSEVLDRLERLLGEMPLPALYVSHSWAEVARLADHLLLLDGGRLRAAGPPAELAARADLPAAALPGEEGPEALVEAVVAAADERWDLLYLDFPGGRLALPRDAALARAPGDRCRLRVAARDVSLALERPSRTSILNVFPARVVAVEPAGPAQVLVRLDAGGAPLLARITRRSSEELGLAPNTAVWAQVKSASLLR